MAHQVQSANKFLFIVLVVFSCADRKTAAVPRVFVQVTDNALQQQQGFLYYSGQQFSGYVYELFSTSDTATITLYINGKQNGWSRQWYPDGKVMEERFYNDGRKEAIHRGWWPDGKMKFEYSFQNNEHHGPAKEWFTNGNIARHFNYVAGHEDGRQQMWWEDGRVRANYVVKEGEQFGLIGRKMCVGN